MAAQYASSLCSRLPPLLFFLQTGLILVFIFYVYIEQNVETKQHAFTNLLNFSGIGFILLVAAMAVQWVIILRSINKSHLVVAEMCTASSLIAIGAVLGNTNPVNLLRIALLEVSGIVLHSWLLQTFLKVWLLNTIMLLHIFRAFFGLMSWVLYRRGSKQQHEKEKIDHYLTHSRGVSFELGYVSYQGLSDLSPGSFYSTNVLLDSLEDCGLNHKPVHSCSGFPKLNFWRPPQDKKCFGDQAFWKFPNLAVPN
uniref:Rh blood group, D antigen n=1 Tax=Salmo trutta TaxID=8032 RepID=A0A674EPG0_SALTR